jgi:protein-disulfide isomerase
MEDMNRARRTLRAAVALLAGAALANAQGAKPGSLSPQDPVAMISGRPVSNQELEEIGKDRLARIKAEELALKRQILEDYIVTRLLEDAARARGLSVPALEKAEIDDRILPVTEDQKRAVFEMVPQNFAGKSEADAFKQIEAQLRGVRLAERRRQYLGDLRRRAGVEILLPEPARAASQTVGDDPAWGSPAAPVTMLVYSDFQCPFCIRAYPTIKQLQAKYKDRMRLVFKDFPLDMHPQAAKAAEAGSCALEQGRFWDYHDRLFENPRALQVPDLKKTAQSLGLDGAKFAQCLDSGKYTTEWQADMAEGQKAGANGTPTFFANGRMVVGAKSLEEMSKIIDEELVKAGGQR